MMAYSSRFVACVLVDGKPQRELGDGTVLLDFGTEYTIRLRNKNPRRAVAHILIDGEDVSGGGYVIPASDYVDIKRHYDKPVGFKFVDVESADAVEFGKNGPNHDRTKGVIEVRFHLEKEAPPKPVVKEVHIHHYDHYFVPKPKPYYPKWPSPWTQPYWSHGDDQQRSYSSEYSSEIKTSGGGMSMSMNSVGPASAGNMQSKGMMNFCRSAEPDDVTLDAFVGDKERGIRLGDMDKTGVTVEGSYSSQTFRQVSIDVEDAFTVVRVVLRGKAKPKAKVQKVETVVDHPSDKEIADLEQEIARAKRIKELKEELAKLTK